jgi:hypothetical protein
MRVAMDKKIVSLEDGKKELNRSREYISVINEMKAVTDMIANLKVISDYCLTPNLSFASDNTYEIALKGRRDVLHKKALFLKNSKGE